MENKWKSLIGIVSGLCLIIGTAFAIDKHFAKQVDHVHLSTSFQQYVIEEQRDKTQQRIWDTEDRLERTRSAEAKAQLKERLRELKNTQEKLDKKSKEIEKKGGE